MAQVEGMDVSVTFLSSVAIGEVAPRAVTVRSGQSLLEAARQSGLPISSVCGGKGTCGKCQVLIDGPAEPLPVERVHLSEEDLGRGVRLACQTLPRPGQVVRILRPGGGPTRILRGTRGRKVVLSPQVQKVCLPWPAPFLESGAADWDRLRASLTLEEVELELAPLRQLPQVLGQAPLQITLALHGRRLVSVEAGDTTDRLYGLAFDIGTTTVVGYLMDLRSGKEVAVASALNPQAAYGEDLISRLSFAQEHPQGLAILQRELVALLNRLIQEAAERAGVEKEHIYQVTLVGNVVMHHLVLGLDPGGLVQAPYGPVVRDSLMVRAGEMGLDLGAQAWVHLLPNVAGFVGSDMVGVLLTTLLHQSPDIQLIIDLGTNGEIALGNRERLLVCSTAAGPAFEGARIRHGMRAEVGAIDRVSIDGAVSCRVIGGGPARGLCGSGLIDAVAQMANRGLIDDTGRLLKGPELPPEVGPKLRAAVRGGPRGEDELRFILVPGEASGTGADICITQQDLREVQLAKGAIFAGIQVLKKELRIGDEDISQALLAGAFGTYVSPRSARRIGLIPPVPLERVKAIGNAAGYGAQLALLSTAEGKIADLIAHQVEHIRLSGRPDFQDYFLRALHFPNAASERLHPACFLG